LNYKYGNDVQHTIFNPAASAARRSLRVPYDPNLKNESPLQIISDYSGLWNTVASTHVKHWGDAEVDRRRRENRGAVGAEEGGVCRQRFWCSLSVKDRRWWNLKYKKYLKFPQFYFQILKDTIGQPLNNIIIY
jgi:hypothetical protein